MNERQSFGVTSRTTSKFRACAFVDGSNTYAACKLLGWDMDWSRLKQWLESRYDLVRIMYYSAVYDNPEENKIQPMLDYISYNGYVVVTKETRRWTDPETQRVKIKGNVDIEITVDALDASLFCSDIFLFTGDGDFRALVERIQRNGVRVHVVSTIQTRQAMIADELRRQADVFYDLADMRTILERERQV